MDLMSKKILTFSNKKTNSRSGLQLINNGSAEMTDFLESNQFCDHCTPRYETPLYKLSEYELSYHYILSF